MDKVKNEKNKVRCIRRMQHLMLPLGVIVAQGMLFSVNGILLNKIMLRMRFIVLWVDTRGFWLFIVYMRICSFERAITASCGCLFIQNGKVKIEWSPGPPNK